MRRTRRHRQHDDGELLEVLEPSPLRVTPRCAHFGVCGGCLLQHLSPQAQLAAKEQELKDTLERVAKVTPGRWLTPLAGPAWGYRRRARLGAKFVHKKDRVVVGFRERAAPYVAQLANCEVLKKPAGDLIAPLAQMLTGLTIRAHVPQIEVAVADNATALVLRVLKTPPDADLERLAAFSAAHNVRLYLQPGGLDSVRPLRSDGEPLHYRLPRFDLQLQFEPTDFVQVNGAINEALVARALELLEPEASARVLDLFCGLGNFSLALARHAAHVVGVEGEASLIERARGNAQRNGIANTEFHTGNLAVAAAPDSCPWLRHSYSHVLLDPPRTGAREVLTTVAALAPRREIGRAHV
jgi:23S rRNA (uracil1939-C5)-methyltransferase